MLDFTQVDGKNIGNIEVFALSTCGWCKKTKDFLSNNGVAFSYLYVDLLDDSQLQEALTTQRKFNPTGSFPTIVVDGVKAIVGFDKPALEELVEEGAYVK